MAGPQSPIGGLNGPLSHPHAHHWADAPVARALPFGMAGPCVPIGGLKGPRILFAGSAPFGMAGPCVPIGGLKGPGIPQSGARHPAVQCAATPECQTHVTLCRHAEEVRL
jgi:hypothetical protein